MNNPVVLILIVLALLVGAASSLGFLDKMIAMLPGQGPVETSPPSTAQVQPSTAQPASGPQAASGPSGGPAPGKQTGPQQGQTPTAQGKAQPGVTNQPANAQPPSKKGESAGTAQTRTKPAAPSGKTPAPSQGKPVATVQPGQAVQASPKQPADTAAKRPKLVVPAFSFKVGRENPFSPFRGSQPGPAAVNPQPRPQSSLGPSTANPPSNPTPKEPVKPAKPDGPRSWRYTGYSANGPHRFAVIETPTNAYIVSTGDRIEGIWLVTEVTGDHVTLRNAEQTIVLPLGGDAK